MKITNVPKNLLNLIQKKKILNASNVLHFRRTARHTISKPSQKVLAEKLLKSKNFPRKKFLSARNSQKIGDHAMPVHMLNGKFTEGNNVALWNAAHQEALLKKPNNTSANLNYFQLLELIANANDTNVNTVNTRLRRTAPRGMNYNKLVGGNNVVKKRTNNLHRYQVGIPGRVQKSFNKKLVPKTQSLFNRLKYY